MPTKMQVEGNRFGCRVWLHKKESHCIHGELFMEHIRFACTNDDLPLRCEYCSKHNWIGPLMKRVPQQIPGTENPGHFLNVFETPQKQGTR